MDAARSRRSMVVAAGLLALVAAIAAGLLLLTSRGEDATAREGPLGAPLGNLDDQPIPVSVGVRSTVGIFFPSNRSVHDVRLLPVRMVMADPGVRLVGARVQYDSDGNRGFLGGAVGFPPRGWKTHPLRGTVLNGSLNDVGLVVGVAATRPGARASL
jgi:hypothetical protein